MKYVPPQMKTFDVKNLNKHIRPTSMSNQKGSKCNDEKNNNKKTTCI